MGEPLNSEELERLAIKVSCSDPAIYGVEKALGRLLTDHAALRARAEAAEAARDQAYADGKRDGEAVGEYQRMEAIGRSVDATLAAHPQPQAPVMGGEG